jgi:CheY-like chemotaxis protein
MPGLDGIEATRQIRRRERIGGKDRRTPIVALTADVLGEQREACERAGMDGFLSKPFSRAQLRAVLDRWLDASTPPSL